MARGRMPKLVPDMTRAKPSPQHTEARDVDKAAREQAREARIIKSHPVRRHRSRRHRRGRRRS